MLESLPSSFNLASFEEEITKYWKENNIFQKSIDQRPEDNLYTFVDGPPFVTGMPHYGSLLPSIAKDVIPRYQTMLGKRVRRVFGWDCHGLPIEDKVNQLFGIKSSTQLEEKLGVEKYVQECRKFVESTSSEWRWYIDKIGRWVDMDNAYYTMHVEFMESVIWAFKKIYEKGLIYQGKRVSLYSTDTSTPVSQFEVAMDVDNYRDVEDLSVFVKFKITDSSKITSDKRIINLVAWTTTPWTIPSNFALAVNKKFDYVLVEYEDELFIVAKSRLEYTFAITDQNKSLVKIIKEFKGSELEDLEYQPVYDHFSADKTASDFKVYITDDVTIDEGTGILHIAPAFGEVDYQMGQKHGISSISDIDLEGKMTVDPWKGIYLRDASPLIAEDMQKNGNLLRSENYTHRLPFYRGKNPLIYMAQMAYFIDIQKIKKRMLELNENINWIPNHIKKGRFANTIETSPDWCISRNRYWATIIPIWKSEDGDEIIIGSLEEFMQFTDQVTKKEVGGKDKYFFQGQPMDLHRDVCDKIILKKDGKEYHRISEVLDCWMDSGSVPFAEYHYPFENKALYEKSRPADFIVEYTPQVRAWFNVLLRISTMLYDDVAFTTAISHGTIAGTDGRKMSKSFGNYPDPKATLEKYGGDALRLYFMGSPVMVGEDMNFSEEAVSDNYKFLLTYWNSCKYFIDYALIFKWSNKSEVAHDNKANLLVMDRWILARLSELIVSTRKSLDSYNIPVATKLIKEFLVNDFSTWYIRRNRDRINNSENEADRNTVLSVMHRVLVDYARITAPIIPFITERLYRAISPEESVHLAQYPVVDKDWLDPALIKDMTIVRSVVEKGHSVRKEASLKLRQPLSMVTVSLPKSIPFSSDSSREELAEVIREELNVKSIEFDLSASKEITVVFDTVLTPELKSEGEARELIRAIQNERKKLGVKTTDKVEVVVPNIPDGREDDIKRAVGAISLTLGDTLKVTLIN